MRKASDFLSKPVISLKEGKNEGIIKNIGFGGGLKTAEWLSLYDENDPDCEEKAVRLADVHIVGEHAVMIKSGQAVVPAVSAPPRDNNPINRRVYTANGVLLGVVSDVTMTDADAVLELIYDNDKALPLREILSGGRGVIVVSAGGITAENINVPEKKIPAPRPADIKRKVKALKPAPPEKPKKKVKFKPVDAQKIVLTAALAELGVAVPILKTARAEKNITSPVEILQLPAAEQIVSEQAAAELNASEQPQPLFAYDTGGGIEIWPLELDHIPERIIANYAFLLGRRVGKNIYNSARELVIRADTVVSPHTVETARKFGRLVDLTKLSN